MTYLILQIDRRGDAPEEFDYVVGIDPELIRKEFDKRVILTKGKNSSVYLCNILDSTVSSL